MAGGGSQAAVNLLTNVAKAAASLGFGATLLSSSLYTVDGGQRAVLFDRFLGVLDQTVGEGTHFRVPMASQIVASGRIIHPGSCNKPSSGGNCNHPWCGTPILVTSPIGATVSTLIANGLFGPEETLKCCHDCLSALVSASCLPLFQPHRLESGMGIYEQRM